MNFHWHKRWLKSCSAALQCAHSYMLHSTLRVVKQISSLPKESWAKVDVTKPFHWSRLSRVKQSGPDLKAGVSQWTTALLYSHSCSQGGIPVPLTPLQFSLAAPTAASRAQSTLLQLWDKPKAAVQQVWQRTHLNWALCVSLQRALSTPTRMANQAEKHIKLRLN